jgi:hypothetical protein
MSSRDQRIAANEALFREVNERIADLDAPHHAELEIICECGDRDCLERITVSVGEYEEARADATLFLARRVLVAQRGDHQLLRKTGEAAAIAEEHDPRS